MKKVADKLLAGSFFAVFSALTAASGALAEPLRLVALGDSLTQGYGLMAEEGLVPQLQGWLQSAGHDVIVINAGVSGDTTAGGLSRLDWTLGDRPDAMMVTLGGNDLLRGIDPAASRANLDAILTRLGAEGLPAPGNYGPEYQAAFAAMYRELAEAHGTGFYEDFLAPVNARMREGGDWQALMQADNTHPNAEGVRLIVEALGPSVVELLERVD